MKECQNCKHYRKEIGNVHIFETCAFFTFKWMDYSTNIVRTSHYSIKIARKEMHCGYDAKHYEEINGT